MNILELILPEVLQPYWKLLQPYIDEVLLVLLVAVTELSKKLFPAIWCKKDVIQNKPKSVRLTVGFLCFLPKSWKALTVGILLLLFFHFALGEPIEFVKHTLTICGAILAYDFIIKPLKGLLGTKKTSRNEDSIES